MTFIKRKRYEYPEFIFRGFLFRAILFDYSIKNVSKKLDISYSFAKKKVSVFRGSVIETDDIFLLPKDEASIRLVLESGIAPQQGVLAFYVNMQDLKTYLDKDRFIAKEIDNLLNHEEAIEYMRLGRSVISADNIFRFYFRGGQVVTSKDNVRRVELGVLTVSTCIQFNNVELKMNEESVVELFKLKKEGFLKL